MQIAAEVRRGNAKHPRRVKMEHFDLEFKPKKSARQLTRAEAAAASKSKWLAMMTMPVEKRTRSPLEE